MLVHDSIVLVTDANRRIGRQFVASLLTRGARRVYAATRQSAALAPIVTLDPARVVAPRMDITNRFEVEAAGRAASDLTLLINIAGVA
jgi:NAD(P)-dependent dehydrogenase (short-subunit alcohol dehydrogenase family)